MTWFNPSKSLTLTHLPPKIFEIFEHVGVTTNGRLLPGCFPFALPVLCCSIAWVPWLSLQQGCLVAQTDSLARSPPRPNNFGCKTILEHRKWSPRKWSTNLPKPSKTDQNHLFCVHIQLIKTSPHCISHHLGIQSLESAGGVCKQNTLAFLVYESGEARFSVWTRSPGQSPKPLQGVLSLTRNKNRPRLRQTSSSSSRHPFSGVSC